MNHRQMLAEADWHAQEAERLRAELAVMTEGHKAAIGDIAVRRHQADAETHQQLADEYRAHVDRMKLLEQAGQSAEDEPVDEGPGLF